MYKIQWFLLQSGSFRSVSFLRMISALILLSVFPFPEIQAQQGNLVIIPRRVVFEGQTKTQDVTLANGGTDTVKYSISLVQMRMKEDGSFEQITTPDENQKFADPYLRFYPRTVTLGPKESQLVKMQVVKTDKLDPGEYRSHIYFRADPKSRPAEENVQQDTTSFSATLTAVFGITIPVIIRVGESTGKATLSDLSLNIVNDTLSKCKMTFNRSGNTSVYGDILIEYISPQGKVTKVGEAQGLAVYTPNEVRHFECRLENIAGINYHTGKLHVVYSNKNGTRPTILSEAELVLK